MRCRKMTACLVLEYSCTLSSTTRGISGTSCAKWPKTKNSSHCYFFQAVLIHNDKSSDRLLCSSDTHSENKDLMTNFEHFRGVHTPAACQLKFVSCMHTTIWETHIGYPLSFILASVTRKCPATYVSTF
jgi:hypothetical protein